MNTVCMWSPVRCRIKQYVEEAGTAWRAPMHTRPDDHRLVLYHSLPRVGTHYTWHTGPPDKLIQPRSAGWATALVMLKQKQRGKGV